jgi:hypothetical protein
MGYVAGCHGGGAVWHKGAKHSMSDVCFMYVLCTQHDTPEVCELLQAYLVVTFCCLDRFQKLPIRLEDCRNM